MQDQFPDGQLYADLRGFDPSDSPTAPAEAIRAFLDALEVPPEQIPVDLPSLVEMYRSLLADGRVLVVLDNAHDGAQIRPLLPGSPGCAVVVTTRPQMPDLVAEGAHPVLLDVLNRRRGPPAPSPPPRQ
jgi:hypothetical protein